MASPIYAPILTSEIESGDPITVSLGLRWAFNYQSVIEGSSSAKTAGMGLWIEKSPSGAPYPAADRQTGILTDCLNTDARLAPDGLGGVEWTTSVVKAFLENPVVHGGGNPVFATGVVGHVKTTSPSGGHVFAGYELEVPGPASLLKVLYCGTVQPGSGNTFGLALFRHRGGSETSLMQLTIQDASSAAWTPASYLFWITDHVAGDRYYLSNENYNGSFRGSLEMVRI